MSDTAGITLSMSGRGQRSTDGPTHGPELILALECSRPEALSMRYRLHGVFAVLIGRGPERRAERVGQDGGIGVTELRIRVPDRWMSSSHARLEHSFGRWVLTDAGSKNGTVVNGEPVQRAVLSDGDLIELGHTCFLFRASAPVDPDTPADLDLGTYQPPAPGIGTLMAKLTRELGKLGAVAASTLPVLIQGQSGTGKEVLARAIHQLSGQPSGQLSGHIAGRRGEFVAVNCGAIPANLVESELFGHKRGAFSGAVDDRPGLIRSADGGTLFLDEIGDLPPASQAALLRVLQEREVTPVGGTRPVPVDLRVVAATHRDLDAMVASGSFRQDLFARLAGFRITLPPLSERRDDLGLLIGLLFRKLARERPHAASPHHPGIEPEAARRLFAYSWPLNIRELEQTLAMALVLAGDAAVAPEHLPEHVRAPAQAPAMSDSVPAAPLSPEDQRLCDELIGHMREQRGNVSAVARAMAKDRKQIQRWIKRFGLIADEYRNG